MSNEIGSILEQLRASVREQRIAQGNNTLSATEQELQRSLDEIELHRVISAHWPLKAHNPVERVINLFNKIVRRLLRWYINPIVEQQNAYNEAVARSLRLLADAYRELAEQQTSGTAKPQNQEPRTVEPLKTATGAAAAHLLQQASNAKLLRPADHTTKQPIINYQLPITALQQLIQQRATSEPEPRFIELELIAQQQQLGLRQNVTAHWPLNGTTSMDRIAALLQTGTRRYLRWLINPIVEQQNNANAAITLAIHQLSCLDAEQRADIAAARAKRKHLTQQ
jgi:hypothetical protein